MKILSYVVPLMLLLGGVFLLFDASTFALSVGDPAIGRVHGCYTLIEWFVGVKSPSWIRSAEFLGAMASVPLSVLLFVIFRRRGHRT